MKVLVCIISILFSFCAQAQENTHMKFMGIDINGNIDSFKTKVASKGFTLVESNFNYIIIQGTFMNEQHKAIVRFDAKTKIVYEVFVGRMDDDVLGKLEEKYGVKAVKSEVTYPGSDCFPDVITLSYGVIGYANRGIFYRDKVNSEKREKRLINEL